MTEERSPSGQPVFRHEAPAPGGGMSAGDPELVAAVDAHLTAHVGAPAQTWHEILSPYVHVDVHVVEPTDERPVFTLLTSGMAERPMAAPDGERFAELMMLLPPTWPGPESPELGAPEAHWPYRLLQDLARLPHEFDTWLGPGHTIPNGDPPEPYAGTTKLCGALIASPLTAPKGFETLVAGDREVDVFAVFPLHADEMELKLAKGADALYRLLDAASLTEIVEPDRPSVVRKRRRLFGR